MTNTKEYTQDKTYDRGDIIYHPVFKDSGKIKKVGQIANGTQKLWVDFDHKGSKILIAGIKKSAHPKKEK